VTDDLTVFVRDKRNYVPRARSQDINDIRLCGGIKSNPVNRVDLGDVHDLFRSN
jgi:hypothetical protein